MGGASTSEVAPLVPGEARSVLAPLGILLPGPAALERACGVALASRAALLLRRAGCERVVRLSSPGNEGKEAARLPRAGWVETGTALPENGTAIVVLGDVVLDALLL
ncbi:hypothetical protein HY251_00420, partial [bacterium]|nr:hypothetical protein [bacterium]